jgi:outer membrane lipoprotein SlyB
MKKIITTFMMFAMMAVAIPMLSGTASAQSQCYEDRYGRVVCNDDNRNIYDKHRNLINIGIGTAAGAIIGGLIGGKKGALIGTAAGAGGAALYTYKLNPKTKRYERVYSRNYRRY